MTYLNKLTSQYPLTERDIREANPNVSFNEVFAAPDDYAWVFPTPKPDYDQTSQIVILGIPNLTQLGHYEETWEIKPRFNDYTDAEGVVHTAQKQLDAEKATKLQETRNIELRRIEYDVDNIRTQAIGTKATEYLRAETDARAFKAAGYEGSAPSTVAIWAEVKEWSEQQAADNIIATADLWLQAEDAIRANRLREKEAVRKASTEAEIITVVTRWSGFVQNIRAQLGL